MEFVQLVPRSFPTNLPNKKDWSQRKCYCRKAWIKFLTEVHEMEVQEDDVWVVTLPKCGTTWMQELVWLVMHDFDFEGARKEHLEVRAPFLEFDFIMHEDLERALKPVENLKRPRQIKSHLPLPLLPKQLWQKKPKTIYVMRDPKDAAIARYHMLHQLDYDPRTLEEHMDTYIENWGWAMLPIEHAMEFYELRNEPWVYYTSFEKMKTNLRQVIEEICVFLDKTITEEQLLKMLQHLSIEEMNKNPTTNHHWEFEQSFRMRDLTYEPQSYIRKGMVGVHKDELSAEFITKLDSWIAEQLAPYNITLDELLLK